jgi:hypothetical protein
MEIAALHTLVRTAVTADSAHHLPDWYVQRHAKDAGLTEREVWDALRVESRRQGDEFTEVLATRKLRRSFFLAGLPVQARVRMFRRSG